MKRIFYQHTVHNTGNDKVVTSIQFDNMNKTVKIGIEQFGEVKSISISMEKAMEIGLINLNALHQIL